MYTWDCRARNIAHNISGLTNAGDMGRSNDDLVEPRDWMLNKDEGHNSEELNGTIILWCFVWSHAYLVV